MDHISVGKTGEDVACTFLKRKGFRIICRNYRKPWGEIDIIAEKDDTVRFVEVKTVSREKKESISRETVWVRIKGLLTHKNYTHQVSKQKIDESYRPEEQVHPQKLQKIARTASLYMDSVHDDRDYQIDVVGIFLNPVSREARCRLLENVTAGTNIYGYWPR